MALTAAQRTFLADLGRVGRDVFAPNRSTMKALRARGLIRCQMIGMRWWSIAPTTTGLAALAAEDAPVHGGPVHDAAKRNLGRCGTCRALRGDPCRTPNGSTCAPHEGRAARAKETK